MSSRTVRGIPRREVLAGGLAAGTGALLLQGAAPAGAYVPSGAGSTGDEHGGAASAEPMALPPLVSAGARMIGIYGTAFYTMVYDPADQATVVYLSAKGAIVSGAGTRLFARVPVEPGARLVQVDYYGYRDTNGQQLWWLSRRDPTTFVVTDLFGDTVIGTGALHVSRAVNELVLPGFDYSVGATSSPSGPYVRGAVIQYLPAAGDFHPVPPTRVYDSRVSGGRLDGGTERTVSVANQIGTATVVVPAGATAVATNLTVDQTTGAGWLSMRPAGSAWNGSSSINWITGGTTLANGVTSQLGGDRQLRMLCASNCSTHFVVDVVGYYL